MVQLSKTRMIYDFDTQYDDVAIFFHTSDEETGESQILDIPIDKYNDLGQPSKITVTIEPGDLLNNDVEIVDGKVKSV